MEEMKKYSKNNNTAPLRVHSGVTNFSINEEPTIDDIPLPVIKSVRRSTLTAKKSMLS